jgi:probable F420-dependent oxidoreductase
VTAEHTAEARQALGSGPWLAPEVGVVLESDPERARRIARGAIEHYMTLPNYTGNWLRLGFSPDDLTGGGSDRLVDALVAWGDDEAIARRVAEHRDAGADHVCIQVLTEDHGRLPLDEWRRLAPALIA